MGRRRSGSSSSSSSSSSSFEGSSGSKHKHKYKLKKEKRHDKHNTGVPSFPAPIQHTGVPSFPVPLQPHGMQFSELSAGRALSPPPPSYQHAPPSGFRIPLTTDAPFPPSQQSGQAPCIDADGISPVYFGSALFPNAVHPCKVAPHLSTPCRVPLGGSEWEHRGRYDLLPFTQDMELIPASGGHVPPGRRPVEGGYEEHNSKSMKLYHAVATIDGIRVPGKCGEHLSGANLPYGCSEVYARDYELLVWK